MVCAAAIGVGLVMQATPSPYTRHLPVGTPCVVETDLNGDGVAERYPAQVADHSPAGNIAVFWISDPSTGEVTASVAFGNEVKEIRE